MCYKMRAICAEVRSVSYMRVIYPLLLTDGSLITGATTHPQLPGKTAACELTGEHEAEPAAE
jgi:hypothetical protein